MEITVLNREPMAQFGIYALLGLIQVNQRWGEGLEMPTEKLSWVCPEMIFRNLAIESKGKQNFGHTCKRVMAVI